MARLAEAQAKLKAVEEKIETLQRAFEEATAKKEALARQVRTMQAHCVEGMPEMIPRQELPGLAGWMPCHAVLLDPSHALRAFPSSAQVHDCTVKLQRADKLIGGLGGERVRWQVRAHAQWPSDMLPVVIDRSCPQQLPGYHSAHTCPLIFM